MNVDEVMINKIRVMLRLQNEMNCRVDADWLAHNRAWYRAIWIECAELMDHYGGWKWWKHSSPDMPQVVLEIVDIWHFGLSALLATGSDDDALAAAIATAWDAHDSARDFLGEVEFLAVTALSEQRFAVSSVAKLLQLCERGFDDLYRAYVAKNVLNMFRQDNGYKSGEYIKIWRGQEDNEVLAELIVTLESDDPNFQDSIYAALRARYLAVVAGSTGAR